jgi:chromate transporter
VSETSGERQAGPVPAHTVTAREIAGVFLRIGATAYGGPAIVAQIRQVTVLERGWLTDEEFAESLAFCQTLPGAIAVQTAAHVAWRLRGPLGALLATFTYVLPAFLLMLGLSAAYVATGSVAWVEAALKGLHAVVVAIILDSIVNMLRPALRDWRGVLIAVMAALALLLKAGALVALLGSALVAVPLFWGQRPPDGKAARPQQAAPRHGRRGMVAIFAAAALFALAVILAGVLDPRLPSLAATMVKVDLLAFGGGYTAVALMHDQVVRVHPWLSNQQFLDGLLMGQITPGPVILTATFIGYQVAGVGGAFMATAAIFMPSWLLLALLAPQFSRIRGLAWVYRMVRGLLAAFVAMLVWVLIQVGGDAVSSWRGIALGTVAFLALRLKVAPLWVVGGGMAASIILFVLKI